MFVLRDGYVCLIRFFCLENWFDYMNKLQILYLSLKIMMIETYFWYILFLLGLLKLSLFFTIHTNVFMGYSALTQVSIVWYLKLNIQMSSNTDHSFMQTFKSFHLYFPNKCTPSLSMVSMLRHSSSSAASFVHSSVPVHQLLCLLLSLVSVGHRSTLSSHDIHFLIFNVW